MVFRAGNGGELPFADGVGVEKKSSSMGAAEEAGAADGAAGEVTTFQMFILRPSKVIALISSKGVQIGAVDLQVWLDMQNMTRCDDAS